MELVTIGELMHLTREELCGLAQRIELTLWTLEPGSAARSMALESLCSIRRVMMLRGFHF